MRLLWAGLGTLRPHVSSSLDSRQPSYRQFTEMVYGPGYSSFCKQTEILRALHSLFREVLRIKVRPCLCKNIYNISLQARTLVVIIILMKFFWMGWEGAWGKFLYLYLCVYLLLQKKCIKLTYFDKTESVQRSVLVYLVCLKTPRYCKRNQVFKILIAASCS